MNASEIDKKFDDNEENILDYFDTANVRMLNEKPQNLSIELPSWMLGSLDKEAKHNRCKP